MTQTTKAKRRNLSLLVYNFCNTESSNQEQESSKKATPENHSDMDKSKQSAKVVDNTISEKHKHDEEALKKYQEEINKKFDIPHEDPPTDPQHLEEYMLKRMSLLEVSNRV